jgi:DNA-binding transcriptional MerR regulator
MTPDASPRHRSRISITEAGRLFGISTNTIRRRVKKGHLTPFQRQDPGGRPRYLFDITDLIRVFGEPGSTRSVTSRASDTDIPSHVTGKKTTEQTVPSDKLNQLQRLQQEHAALKARFEAQSRHLEDLQRLLTPRLVSPDSVGQRASRYVGELARAFRGQGR